MTLLIGDRLGSRHPTYRSGPQVGKSLGGDAVDLAELAGLSLDDWQSDVLDGGMQVRSDGQWASFENGMVVPRQNGKGSILEAIELHGLFCEPDCRLILHSAHEFKTAKEAFRRVVSLVDGCPQLKKLVDHIRYTTGEEGIETKDGSRLKFVARSSGSGRGFSGDKLILDEAYNLSSDMMAALLPTMSARPNPQIWYASSAPLPYQVSDVLRRLCRRGRSGESGSLAYFEWCAQDCDELDDPEAWARANPALGIRISPEFVERELEALGPAEFPRERLGIWPDEDGNSAIIDPKDWAATARPEMRLQDPVSFAVDIPMDRSCASIGAAGATMTGEVGVELVDHDAGTRWVKDRVIDLYRRHGAKAVAIDVGSAAGSLIVDLENAGVEVERLGGRDHAQACGAFYDAVKHQTLEHMPNDLLTLAVHGASKRMLGDAWLWDRRNAAVDISPLVAVTLARRAHVGSPAKLLSEDSLSVW